MIRIEHLDFAYNGRPVFRDLSFDVSASRLTALVGPNGSGKTTLLKCIAQILSPDAGTVLVQGRMAKEMRAREMARQLAYMPQRLDTAFPMTVFDLVLTGRRPYIAWRPAQEDLNVTWRVMETVGIAELAARYIDELSGGETQKIFLARALAQDSGILLLDEPTSNLDVYHQLEMMELLSEAAHAHGKTVLMALHDLNLAGRYADRILLIHRGTLVADGTPLEVLTPANIHGVYGVDAAVHVDADGLHVICSFPDKLPETGQRRTV
jgi:iron complex transport system ATP-binding protein